MKIKKTFLSNGIKLILVNLPDSPSVTTIIFNAVGSRYEQISNSGVTHLIEHSIFNGSKKYPTQKEVSFSFESLGASIDAGTSKEYTFYLAKCVKENFFKVFDILSDLYINPLFSAEEINKEKKVVIEEIRMYRDNPMESVMETFSKYLWAKQPIGRGVSGTIKSVKELDAVKLRNFINKYYNTGFTQIIISGDLQKISNIAQTVGKKFSVLTKGIYSSPQQVKNDLLKNTVICKTEKVEQTHIVFGTYGPGLNNEDRFSTAVGNTILGQGMGSNLFRSIRQKHGLAYYVNSGNLSYVDSGAIYIRAGVDNRRIEKSLKLISEEINNLLNGEFNDHDLNRARELLKSALVLELDSSDSMGLYIGLQDLLIGRPLSIREVKKRVDSVTKDEVLRVFQKMFKRPKLLTMIAPIEIDTRNLEEIISTVGEK